MFANSWHESMVFLSHSSACSVPIHVLAHACSIPVYILAHTCSMSCIFYYMHVPVQCMFQSMHVPLCARSVSCIFHSLHALIEYTLMHLPFHVFFHLVACSIPRHVFPSLLLMCHLGESVFLARNKSSHGIKSLQTHITEMPTLEHLNKRFLESNPHISYQ